MTKVGFWAIVIVIATLLIGLVFSVSGSGQDLRNIKFEIISLSVLGVGCLFTTLSVIRLLKH